MALITAQRARRRWRVFNTKTLEHEIRNPGSRYPTPPGHADPHPHDLKLASGSLPTTADGGSG
jgi:hypothetical protein